MSWADDPELLATFRTEVEDRLVSLREGLLALEADPANRARVASLFRDAHTVKGSARMLGLDEVVSLAHLAEDALGALRDGRTPVTADVVNLLLVACTAIARGLPGAEDPLVSGDADRVVAALRLLVHGEDFTLPVLAEPERSVEEPTRGRADAVRVPPRRLYDLLDAVGEAELEIRRADRRAAALARTLHEHVERLVGLRTSASLHPLPPDLADAVHGLSALEDQLVVAAREMRGALEEGQGRLAQVRARSLRLAMVPLGRMTAGLTQLVREVATTTGKEVRLVVTGEDVELDSRVLDGVAEALGHLITNAVDHGCETVEQRQTSGKPRTATVSVSARAAGSAVVIEVSDDGAGIDVEHVRRAAIERGLLDAQSTASPAALLQLLLLPEFSTRSSISVTSGRGVGLDAVRAAVEELGGSIDIESEFGSGSRFLLTLPVSLGVMRCLLARVGTERYAIPLTGVVETLALRPEDLHHVAGAPVLPRAEAPLPVADLGTALGVTGARDPRVGVVVRFGGGGDSLAWMVDALEGETELVVKELGDFLGRPRGVAGATIHGDGSVVLLLDVRELAATQLGSQGPGTIPERTVEPLAAAPRSRPRVLVVEDSVGVRELERVVLEGAGYEVLTAVDGLDGARRLADAPVDAVVSDVEMPGMDGFTLTRTIRRTRGWEDVPVVIMTSRGDSADQRAGLDAGASAYLLKSEFDQHELVETVRRLVGR